MVSSSSNENSERYPLTAAPAHGLYRGQLGGLRVTVAGFAVISVAVTVALVVNIVYGVPEVTPHAAVVSDHNVCSRIGTEALSGGGSAVDAAVATAICLTVVHPHTSGLAGGGFMLVHRQSDNISVAFDFRESTPTAAEPLPSGGDIDTTVNIDGATVGVPGLLRGLEAAHRRFGRLPWSRVVDPSIALAKAGVPVSPSLAAALRGRQERAGAADRPVDGASGARSDSGMGVFEREGRPLAVGEMLHQPELAESLSIIRSEGADALYSGSLLPSLLAALSDTGSRMTRADLATYRSLEYDVLTARLGNMTLVTTPAPSGGPGLLLQLLLTQMVGLSAVPAAAGDSTADQLFYTQLTDILRLSGLEHARLGDPALVANTVNRTAKILSAANVHNLATLINDQEQAKPLSKLPAIHSSAATHVAVVGFDEMFVSLVSGLGSHFGAGVRTASGVMLNNALASFYNVPTDGSVGSDALLTHNTLAPGRRPLSSYTPALLLPDMPCRERVVTGGADGQFVGQMLLQLLGNRFDPTSAGTVPRLSADPSSVLVKGERDGAVTEPVAARLSGAGYQLQQTPPPYASCNVLLKLADTLVSYADPRGGGAAYHV